MKLNWKVLYTGIAATMILTACGTDGDNIKDSSTDSSIEVNNDENQNASDGTNSETDVDTDSTEVESTSDDEKLTEAVETKSDEQDYTINVLPGFTLTSEEPGRDSLYSDDNPEVFMRIETKQQEDGLYAYLLDNMQEVLKASSEDVDPEALTGIYADESAITNVQAFHIDTAEGIVTGVLYETGEKIVRLTIYDTDDEKFTSDFLKMGKTIR
ncbi:hypothetical protein QWT69_10015 [Sporosarcina oncorhynchi]|uniref:Lipoprotein n=1 Tax=Sporosarcina oncorhynchi TaxID=3056444 RepID=A0ABZ0L278_9BACL|nr:hypothetical protein [Sporosarcina sp. T2O-4]WOV86279.1 hypothetical protein QWT69_10015 [Sporosarcina sp. T2O-4]